VTLRAAPSFHQKASRLTVRSCKSATRHLNLAIRTFPILTPSMTDCLSPISLRFGASVLIWLVLPASLSFGVASNAESAFRSTPTNDFYDGMFVAITAALALVHMFIVLSQYRQLDSVPVKVLADEESAPSVTAASVFCLPLSYHPISALYGFELMLLFFLATLNYVAGMVASGAVWTVAFISVSALHFNFYRWCSHLQETQRLRWTDAPPVSTVRRAVLTFFYVLWGIGFLAFPVFQSWSGPPQSFVRWFAFTESGELVWRGIFASYAAGFFSCVFDPFNRHAMFILYVAVSGLLHAGFMLVANLYSHAHGLANGNREHLYGDIGGWFLVALFSAAVLIGVPLTPTQPSASIEVLASSSESDSSSQVPLTSSSGGLPAQS
jgi:hypothetical protein